MAEKQFTWIPFFKEFADKLLEYKEKREELVEIVYSLDGKYVNYIHNDDGNKVTDIDPFSVFAIFNRGVADDNRKIILSHFKDKLGIVSELPHDYDGVPILNAQKSIFFGKDNANTQILYLWNLFESAITRNQSDFVDYFDKLQQTKGIKWNLTIGLYWIRPDEYMPLDGNSRTYLQKKGIHVFDEKEITANNYLNLLKNVKDGFSNNKFDEKSMVELSYSAWKLNKNENVNFWLVGYSWGGDKSQIERFFQKSIWEGRFDNIKDGKQIELAREINKGDILILKSTSTKGTNHNIPFLRISALAKVDEINETTENGKAVFSCSVEYFSNEKKDITGNKYGQFRKTIHKCTNKEIINYVMSKMNHPNNQSNTLAMQNDITNKLISLLRSNHNLILTGAPGTGKTYLAKQIAQRMIFGETKKEMTDEEQKQFNEQCGFVQFHPSYDYTDFVEGLRPKQDDSETVGFERKDGVFKTFCANALENILDSQKSEETLQKENLARELLEDFLQNAIDSDENFETQGTKNNFHIIESKAKTITIDIPKNEKARIISLPKSDLITLLENEADIKGSRDLQPYFNRKYRTQQDSYTFVIYEKLRGINANDKTKNVSLVEKKNYVFIIDEINRGEISKIFGELFFSIDPGYRGIKGKVETQYQNLIKEDDDFYEGFYVPENVYIIGTMNDIDRSVESMDFAFRRRFAFKEIKAIDRVEMLYDAETGIGEYAEKAKNRMIHLNEEIEKIEGLSSAYHVGPAYFLKLKNYNGDFSLLWKYHLEGLLREYLRGMQDIKGKIEVLNDAYNNDND